MTYTVELKFCSANRAHALGQHQAYVAGVIEKLIPAFESIEAEADQYAHEVYDRLCSTTSWDGGADPADLAEQATDAGVSRYSDLLFVKGELIGFATGGLYHLWEKTLKSFLISELGRFGLIDVYRKKIGPANHLDLIKWLADMGFDINGHQYEDALDVCRLVANTVKHGDGASCQQLATKAPELLRGPAQLDVAFGKAHADELWIKSEKFRELADSIESFWNEFPEHLSVPKSLHLP